MKFYGDANLQQNELQNAVLSTLTSFPQTPKVGQFAFVNSIVFVCVTAGSTPVWVPLTREITAYTHTQESPATTWTFTHGLNTTSINVQIYDASNNVIIPDSITSNGATGASVSFGTAQSGRAVVITGHFDGNVKPNYAYTHFQSDSNTSWVITHNLGYNPIVRVFIGTSEVQPASVTHNSSNQVTITFATPQVGYARLL